MVTLNILGGRKEKIRPGDILGALTKDAGFSGEQVGKINVNELSTYVAVERSIAQQALRKLNEMTVKGKKIKAFALGDGGAKPAKSTSRDEQASRADKPAKEGKAVWTKKPPAPAAKPERQGRAAKLAPRGGRGR